MSNLKFTFECDLNGNSNTQRFNTLSSKFGDGYEQNIAVGINNRSGEWTYQRTAYKAEIMQIKAFFDQHKGADSFLWDSPLDGEVRVKTGEYQPRCLGGDVWQISTTFTPILRFVSVIKAKSNSFMAGSQIGLLYESLSLQTFKYCFHNYIALHSIFRMHSAYD